MPYPAFLVSTYSTATNLSQVGTLCSINERYLVDGVLGSGRMGGVYLARLETDPTQQFAIKVLSPEHAYQGRQGAMYRRFRNEIWSLSQINNANVIRICDKIASPEVVAFVMEYAEAGTLASKINSGRLPISSIIKYLIQVCDGVQSVHEAGILHRDLKPENILLSANGDVKISDFGAAEIISGPSIQLPGTVGTLQYLSPEYLLTGRVGVAGEVYSIGIIAYEMVTGQTPFFTAGLYESVSKRVLEDPPRPELINPDCSMPLADLVMRAISRDPKVRFDSAAEFAGQLRELVFAYPAARLGLSFSRPMISPELIDDKHRYGSAEIPVQLANQEPNLNSIITDAEYKSTYLILYAISFFLLALLFLVYSA